MRYLFVVLTALLLGLSAVACNDLSTPTEPTQPTEPSDPNDPTNPDDPNDPDDPTDPDPVDPGDPTDPADPNDPTDPSEPAGLSGQLVLSFSPSGAAVTIADVATQKEIALSEALESSVVDPVTGVRTDTYKLEVGLYEIRLNAAGYSPYRVQETIAEDKAATLSANLDYTLANPPLTLSADNRGLLSGGSPFLWVGDTAWALFTATSRDDVTLYLDDAKAKGFNVVQTFLTTIWTTNGDNGENKFGDAPYIDNDPTRLNPAYFDYVEWVVDEAGKRGLYVAILYGGPGRGDDGRIPYRLTSVDEAYDYGNAVGQRFRTQTLANNIIWINGQDWAPQRDLAYPMWKNIAEGLSDGVNGVTSDDDSSDYSSTFMSFHTDGCCSSSLSFNNEAWLDFNGINTWKRYFLIVDLVQKDYSLLPAKPSVCLENTYEDHNYDGEYRDDWYVRFQAYWCVFSGAAGYAYGHADGYKMTESPNWPGFFDKPGRLDAKHLKTLLTAHPFEKLVPDQSLIVSDEGSAEKKKTYIAATRARTGDYALVYTTQGDSFDLDLSGLSASTLSAKWFDPREGSYQDAGTVANGTSVAFDPPGTPGEDNDWVLVIDARP